MWIVAAVTALLAALGVGTRRRTGDARRGRGAVPAVLLATALVVAMAQTIVVAVLPVLRERLDTTPAGAAWLLTAFMLASAVAVPIGGRLGDDVGHRRVLVVVLAVFAAATAVAGVADLAGSYAGVLVGRALQGVGGAAFPLVLGIARTTDPSGGNSRLVAALSAMFGVGGAVGMIVAGPVADLLGTAWLFWVTLLLALLCLAGTALLPAGSARTGTVRLDVPGAVLLSGALVCLLLVISEASTWTPAVTVGVAAAAVVLGTAFVVVERRAAAPLVDLATISRGPLAATNLATLVVSTAMFAAVTLLPLLVQTPTAAGYGFGLSATGTGVLMVPVAVLMIVAGPLAPAIAARLGARAPFHLGAGLAAAAFVLLALSHDQLWQPVAIRPPHPQMQGKPRPLHETQ